MRVIVRQVINFIFQHGTHRYIAQNNNLEISINNNSKIETKDYGIRGHVFPIIEESLLEIIMGRLKIPKENGVLEKMQKAFAEKVRKKISRPTAVVGLTKSLKIAIGT